jgi:hypothetical protein
MSAIGGHTVRTTRSIIQVVRYLRGGHWGDELAPCRSEGVVLIHPERLRRRHDLDLWSRRWLWPNLCRDGQLRILNGVQVDHTVESQLSRRILHVGIAVWHEFLQVISDISHSLYNVLGVHQRGDAPSITVNESTAVLCGICFR